MSQLCSDQDFCSEGGTRTRDTTNTRTYVLWGFDQCVRVAKSNVLLTNGLHPIAPNLTQCAG